MKKKSNHGAHGGSWKVAYADFVTALMTFFLVMWLVNIVPDERKKELANFFSSAIPFNLDVKNGAIGMMTGIGVMDQKEGEDTVPSGEKHKKIGKYNDKKKLFQEEKKLKQKAIFDKGDIKPVDKVLKNPQKNIENRAFQGSFFLKEKASGGHQISEETTGVQETLKYPNIKKWAGKKRPSLSNFTESDEEILETFQPMKKMQKTMQQTIQKNIEENLPKWLQKYIKIEESGKEIRITLFDTYHAPMFLSGQHTIQREIRNILSLLAETLKDKKYLVRIEGHTDSTPYKRNKAYTNLDLSIARANACKNWLEENGIEEKQFEAIIGHGDSKPFNLKNPAASENRRIELFLTPKKS